MLPLSVGALAVALVAGCSTPKEGSGDVPADSSDCAVTWYADNDGDGAGGTEETLACDAPPGHVAERTDCDDTDGDVGPFAIEVCGGVDDDCDGLVDDADPDVDLSAGSSSYEDADGDGFGNPEVELLACAPADGWVADGTDCDDTNPTLAPTDLDLDGITSCDGDCVDSDPTIYPGAPEPDCTVDLDCDPRWPVAYGPPILLPMNLHDFVLADLDLDGDQDLATASVAEGTVSWWPNLGAGAFGPPNLVWDVPGSGPWEVVPADLDGDGDADLVVGLMDADTLSWFENLGGGAFGPAVVLTTDYGNPGSIAAADLDADGDLDLAFSVAEEFSPDVNARVLWYPNPGAGEPAPILPIGAVGEGPAWQAFGDLDADGDLDIVATSWLDDRVVWFENLGGAVFGRPLSVSVSANDPTLVRVADLDLDGLPDVVVGSAGDDTIAWYRNLGGAVFAAESIVSAAMDNPVGLRVADLDADGDGDLVAGAYFGDRLVWFENLGGTFGAEQVIDAALYGAARVVVADDLFGDGHPDLLAYGVDTDVDALRLYPSLCE